MAEVSSPRAVDWTVVKAAVGGAGLASLVMAAAFGIDAQLHPSGGPLNFSGPSFVATVFLISLAIGATVSLVSLSAAIAIFGGERLQAVSPPLAALIGAFAGLVLLWVAVGLRLGDWRDFKTIAFGGLYGTCVAGLWSHLVRR
jgi:hypothetical protein